MTNAVMYLRQSLDAKDDRLAVARQEKDCAAIAKARGWTITRKYVDNDLSASKRDVVRPDYNAMVAAYERGEFEAIVCWDLDRLTRQPRQLEDWIERAEERGLLLVTANGEADLATDGGRMYARIKAAVARAEIERKGARQKAQQRQRREAGKPHWYCAPFGWTKDGEIVPEQAEAIRWAAEAILKGATLVACLDEWNRLGLTVPRTGQPFNRISTVRDILVSDRVRGVVLADGHEVKATFPAILDDATAYRLRAVLLDPERKVKRPVSWRYSRIFTCGRCGAAMQGRNAEGHESYVCPSRHLTVQWDRIEDEVRTEVVELALEAGLQAAVLPGLTDDVRVALEARKSAILDDLDGLALALAKRTLTLRQVEIATSALQDDLAAVQAELDKPHEVKFTTLAEVTAAALTVDNLRRFEIKIWPATVSPRVTVEKRAA